MKKFVVTGKKLGIRDKPTLDSKGEKGYLTTGETFGVAEEKRGRDGRIYFRLADGRGWVYNRSSKDFSKIVVEEVVPSSRPVASPATPAAGTHSGADALGMASLSDSDGDVNTTSASEHNSESGVESNTELEAKSDLESTADTDAKLDLVGMSPGKRSDTKAGNGVGRAWVAEQWSKLKVKHGLDSWQLGFDKCKRSFGKCSHKKQVVSLSDHFLTEQTTTKKMVLNTLLHEIAHALVGKTHGHDSVWRAKAISIGCDGRRCHSHAIVSSVEKPFELRCKKGCWSVGRYHQGVLSDTARCRQCKGGLEYLHNGKLCKLKLPTNKYELRCCEGCWSVPKQRRQKKQMWEKKRCKQCGSKVAFGHAKRKQPTLAKLSKRKAKRV
eukprot:TRINITY_DN30757_c0_g1_i1.p1 TRINITY_DN30757_c0_g1~~TRINITY_DN30757_c0_g1_i1.p1  ORF type:complete len:382 (+),score=65.86 TRINITY_DN30757_c0_g1_i1:149-1294(+)